MKKQNCKQQIHNHRPKEQDKILESTCVVWISLFFPSIHCPMRLGYGDSFHLTVANCKCLQRATVGYKESLHFLWVIVFLKEAKKLNISQVHSFLKQCLLGKFRESTLFWINWRWYKHCFRNDCSLREVWKLPSEFFITTGVRPKGCEQKSRYRYLLLLIHSMLVLFTGH